ncbi:hypothetical protein XENTR_v10011656 [Xenopus tropicalis]|nr:hypothetical protein XENTR_v10011656 [Xenopus tropicalis]
MTLQKVFLCFPLPTQLRFSAEIFLAVLQTKCQLDRPAYLPFQGRYEQWRALIIYKGHDRKLAREQSFKIRLIPICSQEKKMDIFCCIVIMELEGICK